MPAAYAYLAVHRRQLADYAAMAVIWGLSFVLVLQVVGAFGWVGAVTFRALIASAILLPARRAATRRGCASGPPCRSW